MEYFRIDSPKDRRAARTGSRDLFGADTDPRIPSVPYFPSAPFADPGASSGQSSSHVTQGDTYRGRKAARFQVPSSPHRDRIKTFVAHAAVPVLPLPLPDARAPATASQRVVEISDQACRELDFAVQSGVLAVSIELRR